MLKKTSGSMITLCLLFTLAGCTSNQTTQAASSPEITETPVTTTSPETTTDTLLDPTAQFTERDLKQTADLTDAIVYTLSDGEDIHIEKEGIYVIQGTATDSTIYVEAGDTDKVQIVLDGISITNTDQACISVSSAKKVFITLLEDSTFTVTDSFMEDELGTDAVIFSKSDLVLNGTAALTISSSDTGISSKDDLKITGGTYLINAVTKAFDANDSIRIADGTFTIYAGTDGFHVENNSDDTKGCLYIQGGTFTINVEDDGLHATSFVQIDGGNFVIDAYEGIEATYIQINGGTMEINASDDGINAGQKSNSYPVTIEITGGDISINMAQGDTDAIDANGDLIISGGTLNINAMSAFDYDGTGTYTGGTLIVNGEQVTELTQSMMGPGMMPPNGDRKDGPPGFGNRIS